MNSTGNVFPVPDLCHTDDRRGNVPWTDSQRHLTGKRNAYSNSSRRSEQLSCIKLFHPSYGLISMNFQSFKHFLKLLKLTEITKKEYDVIIAWG